MAQIKEFSSADLNTISRFGGVSNTLEKINGVTVVSSAPAVPAPAAAYSVRLLGSAVGISSYTGPCMRVRRNLASAGTGHDDEADVAFDTNGEISLDSAVSNFNPSGSSATTLGQFLAASGYTDVDSLLPDTITATVSGWYDQSGNSNNATQSTPSQQPQIYNGTAVITENGKPALQTDGTTSNMVLLTSSFTGDSGPVSVFAVRNSQASSNQQGLIIDQTTQISFGSSDGFRFDAYNNEYRFGTNSNFTKASYTPPTGQQLQSGIANSSGRTLYIDGSSVGTTSGDQTTTGVTRPLTVLGSALSNVLPFNGTAQEIILYTGTSDGDQSSNASGIETNIDNYFQIPGM
jgi:hypothetical protein